jgi:hypothetical protein
MNIDEKLKVLLTEIQKPANENLIPIVEIKKKLIEAQNFEEAIIINKIEKSLLDFISISDTITMLTRTIKIQNIFNKQNIITMNEKKITQEENHNLQLDLIKEFGRTTTLDGILNLEEYNKSNPKILWILKEPNWGDDYIEDEEDNEPIDDLELNEIHNELLENKYYDDVTVYNHWQKTFKNISYITHGVIDKVYKFDDMSDIDREAKIDGKYYLKNIAFINLKKIPGGSYANSERIYESYVRHKAFFKKQIETINPDIIFNCSGVNQLFLDLSEGSEINKNYGFNFSVCNSRLIINTYHPMQTTIGHEEYVDLNLQIIKDYFNNEIKK